jgi:hypothetical protein
VLNDEAAASEAASAVNGMVGAQSGPCRAH